MLVVENISAGYVADIEILSEVSLNVPEGQIVSIIGPNGAGKSTLLRTICGFLDPTNGQVHYQNQLLTGLPPSHMTALGISYLPQERTVFPALSVDKNLRLGGWSLRKDKPRLRRALEQVYTRFPFLAERRTSKAGNLSGGQQKILEVARGLIIEPQLLVVDEPSVGLAPRIAKDIYAILRDLREQNLTILLVDQNVREAVALADHIYVLELGCNSVDGSRHEFETNLHDMIKEWLQI
ncbi:MAG: ABC transporter ATP-binding protein [Candidatus Tectomicrobia bacterium]|nr:ABC transporter ATP-binding protein [Candidatus Tectomicrobia bacterium]